MAIDLTNVVLQDNMNEHIDQDVLFDDKMYFLPELSKIKKAHFTGDIKTNLNDEILLTGTLNADLILLDSINLEDRDYKISTEIKENLDNLDTFQENSIDIIDVLWQNIVLEVPSRYTEVTDYGKYHGDGWKLVSEEDFKTSNNPFAVLKDKE